MWKSLVSGISVMACTKYTPEGGVITISYKQYGNHITIRVRDSGIGMVASTLGFVTEVLRNPELNRIFFS